jgi:hypothetical protein
VSLEMSVLKKSLRTLVTLVNPILSLSMGSDMLLVFVQIVKNLIAVSTMIDLIKGFG